MDTNAGVRLGGSESKDPDILMTEAIQLATEADAVIAVVGLNSDWETEGYDRTTLALPGRTDELVSRVAKANKNTIVVTQSGSSITLPWADEVTAILHSWYLGNITGEAIGDILTGKVNPSAKLSLTFPKHLEDVPSHGHFHSENGKVRYGEDLFVVRVPIPCSFLSSSTMPPRDTSISIIETFPRSFISGTSKPPNSTISRPV